MLGRCLWRCVCGVAGGWQGYPHPNIPCFTSIREPIDRLVSLYYYMVERGQLGNARGTRGIKGIPLLQDMTPGEVVAALSDIWPVMRQTPLLSHFGTWARGGAGVCVCA